MQSDSPVGMVKDDLWIDTTSIPYSMSSYSGTAWISVGSAGGTKINDWVSASEYKQGEYIVKDSLLYRCVVGNSDVTFTASNWTLISGHMIKDDTSSFTKRTNLKFTGTGVTITDDLTNDSTIITVNGDVTKTGTEILTNKSLIDSSTKIIDEADNTKVVQFEASGITTGTTRKLSIPDKNGTIATITDITDVTDQVLKKTSDVQFNSIDMGTGTKIKIKKFIGTMPSTGQSIEVNHGLDQTKIINFSCIVKSFTDVYMLRLPFPNAGTDIEYSCRIRPTTIWLTTGANGTSIAGRSYTALIWYEV